MADQVTIAAPWIRYARKVRALFAKDSDVTVEYKQDDNPELNLYITGEAKAAAWTQLLPTAIEFGNVTLKINVIPANVDANDINTILKNAFTGNDIFWDAIIPDPKDPFALGSYFIFDNDLVQYPDDDISNYAGVCTTTYADIVQELIGAQTEGVFFNTVYDPDNDLNSDLPSQVWPYL